MLLKVGGYCTHAENIKLLIFELKMFKKYRVLLVNFYLSKLNGNMIIVLYSEEII